MADFLRKVKKLSRSRSPTKSSSRQRNSLGLNPHFSRLQSIDSSPEIPPPMAEFSGKVKNCRERVLPPAVEKQDFVNDRDRDNFLTLPENSAVGGGRSEEVSMLCDLEECGFNPNEFLCLEEDFIGDRDRDNFLTLPENWAIGGGSLGEELML
ncbi:hypothetical protein NL676_035355 [Syzygium grande]|nr:hypothetical protein NL676_035355 [Syzygium grande]